MEIRAVVFTVHKAGEDILVDSPLDLLGWDFICNEICSGAVTGYLGVVVTR